MDDEGTGVRRRIVAHFPGFEPLDAAKHYSRFLRASDQSALAFGYSLRCGPSEIRDAAPHFPVTASGDGWHQEVDFWLFDHAKIIAELNAAPLHIRVLEGFRAGFTVLAEGGFYRYMRIAWRFGLFFVAPFLFFTLGLLAIASGAFVPLLLGWDVTNLLWTLPLAAAFGLLIVAPLLEKLHTLHLFSQWRLAVTLAHLDDNMINETISRQSTKLGNVLDAQADEHLITCHSLGSAFALHALGKLLENNPRRFDGKTIRLVTLAGSGMQASLLRSAALLRQRIGAVLSCPQIEWTDFQCLTDPVNLYGARIARDNGFPDLAEPAIVKVKVRNCLTAAHYRRIKWDLLRVHRQFVLGPDRTCPYDFTLLTCGPFAPRQFMDFWAGNLPVVGHAQAAGGKITSRAGQ